MKRGERPGRLIPAWLDAVSDMEALSALANYAWEHPADPLPQFEEGTSVFDGEEMAHPLIPSERAVPNSVCVSAAQTRVFVVSGSNMSGGKIMLLRTVGGMPYWLSPALLFAPNGSP